MGEQGKTVVGVLTGQVESLSRVQSDTNVVVRPQTVVADPVLRELSMTMTTSVDVQANLTVTSKVRGRIRKWARWIVPHKDREPFLGDLSEELDEMERDGSSEVAKQLFVLKELVFASKLARYGVVAWLLTKISKLIESCFGS